MLIECCMSFQNFPLLQYSLCANEGFVTFLCWFSMIYIIFHYMRVCHICFISLLWFLPNKFLLCFIILLCCTISCEIIFQVVLLCLYADGLNSSEVSLLTLFVFSSLKSWYVDNDFSTNYEYIIQLSCKYLLPRLSLFDGITTSSISTYSMKILYISFSL